MAALLVGSEPDSCGCLARWWPPDCSLVAASLDNHFLCTGKGSLENSHYGYGECLNLNILSKSTTLSVSCVFFCQVSTSPTPAPEVCGWNGERTLNPSGLCSIPIWLELSYILLVGPCLEAIATTNSHDTQTSRAAGYVTSRVFWALRLPGVLGMMLTGYVLQVS